MWEFKFSYKTDEKLINVNMKLYLYSRYMVLYLLLSDGHPTLSMKIIIKIHVLDKH